MPPPLGWTDTVRHASSLAGRDLMTRTHALVLLAAAALAGPTLAAEEADTPLLSSETFEGLKLRNIGPALMSGRIADIAIHPGDRLGLVRGGGLRRGVEDRQRRDHLDAPLRRGERLLHRLRHRRPVQPPRRLGRHRGGRGRPPRGLRRRGLPQPRRRRPLGEPRPEGVPARHEDHRAPRGLGRRVGGGAGAAVVEGRRARASTRPPTAARRGTRSSAAASGPARPPW